MGEPKWKDRKSVRGGSSSTRKIVSTEATRSPGSLGDPEPDPCGPDFTIWDHLHEARTLGKLKNNPPNWWLHLNEGRGKIKTFSLLIWSPLTCLWFGSWIYAVDVDLNPQGSVVLRYPKEASTNPIKVQFRLTARLSTENSEMSLVWSGKTIVHLELFTQIKYFSRTRTK